MIVCNDRFGPDREGGQASWLKTSGAWLCSSADSQILKLSPCDQHCWYKIASPWLFPCHGDPWRWWVAWSADCCADAGQGGHCWYLCIVHCLIHNIVAGCAVGPPGDKTVAQKGYICLGTPASGRAILSTEKVRLQKSDDEKLHFESPASFWGWQRLSIQDLVVTNKSLPILPQLLLSFTFQLPAVSQLVDYSPTD